MFQLIEEWAIIIRRGVYRQVDLAVWNGIYARHGMGWIRLSKNGVTSSSGVRWVESSCKFNYDKLGRAEDVNQE